MTLNPHTSSSLKRELDTAVLSCGVEALALFNLLFHYLLLALCWSTELLTEYVTIIVIFFIEKRVQFHPRLEEEPRVQAHLSHHSEQQQQLIVAVHSWTEAQTHLVKIVFIDA
ncbi:hypothetical protein EYF80_014495 [Liparis tanakae]|uniref:Uncharacterized protein n=1 Tax=Liparis tanakae TaxID=230148 RepID=A0A4Z2IB68_9TELE|nr:hypothetical protein EYF80_014495 [Liparis tanakae]